MNTMHSLIRALTVALLLTTASGLTAQTVDTIAGLVTAITAANANSAATTINLTGGTYTLTANLPNLAANHLTLQGPATGTPAILDASALVSGVIFNVTADQVTIASLTLRNARTHAIAIQPGADQGRIENCVIANPTTPFPATAAIDGNNCQNWTITGNALSSIIGTTATAEPAIHFYGGASGTTVTNNLILNCDRAIGLGGDAPNTDPTPIAPAIPGQPQNATVTVGQTATFTVTATGTPPLRYQWRKNGSAIDGARFTAYTTPITSQADSGALFSVIVTDDAGANTTSANATLTVSTGTLRSQHYVDPVNGTASGDGSSSNPWKSLQDVIDHQVETRAWEALPYTVDKKLVPVNVGALVKAGDTIWLRSGYYGALTIQSAYNIAPITVAAEANSVPKFSNVLVQSAQNWILRGFSVSPSYAPTYSADTIVTAENHSWRGPAYDIVIDGFEIFSVPDETVWPLASDWDTKAANGITASGARVVIRNCRLRNINFGISMDGDGSRVEHNTIDGFCGDGMRGNGDDEAFEYNLVKNLRLVNANHPDGFQSWSTGSDGAVGTGVVKNITLRGNVFISYENTTSPFIAGFQGIGCFDGTYENWVVENNVVFTDTYHGIAFYGAHNVRIVNNTVLDLNSTNAMTPWILVTDHKNGDPSRSCIVRNNLTTTLNVTANVSNSIVVDHNLVVPKNPVGYFVDLALHNARLAAGSPAIDQGSASQAPTIDADEKSRPQGAAVDVGAYEYRP